MIADTPTSCDITMYAIKHIFAPYIHKICLTLPLKDMFIAFYSGQQYSHLAAHISHQNTFTPVTITLQTDTL